MASKAFLAALRGMKENKSVESILVGTNYLGEGEHDVTIKAVDTTQIDQGKLGVVFEDSEGKVYNDNLFLMSQQGDEFSYGLRMLLSGLIPDKEALGRFLDLAETDDKAFEVFTGMKLRIKLQPGKGVQARATGLGTFAGFDVESNEKVTEEYGELKEVYAECKGRGIKRSYQRITKAQATDKEFNLQAFETALAAKAAAKTGVTGSAFSAGKIV